VQRRRGQLEARARGFEERALSAGGAGGTWIPTGPPAYVADQFAVAARERAALAALLPEHPIPEKGMTTGAPRLSSGASVDVTAEGSAISSTDPADVFASSPVSLISGHVTLSQQLLDRADPTGDVWLAAELGRAHGEKLDEKLLAGSGTAPELRGLLNVTGLTSVAYTDASPTQAEAWPKLMDA